MDGIFPLVVRFCVHFTVQQTNRPITQLMFFFSHVPTLDVFLCSFSVLFVCVGPGSVSHTVDEEILCIVYHEVDPDEQKRVFLTGGNDSIIRIWNVFSYQMESTLQGHEDSVTCMALDANFLFSGSDDKTIRVWNLVHVDEPYQLSVIQHAHLKPIQDILILEDTGHLVSCSFDGKIRVWDWGHEDDQSGEGFGDGVVGEGGNVVEGSEGGQKTHTGSAAKHETKEDDDKEDHGGHSVLHEFVHPSQFRCLGYYPNQGDILVGTEESNILTFSLPSSVTGKGGPRPTSATGKYAGVPEEQEEAGLVGGEEKFESKYDENMDDEGGERRTGLLSEQ
jgi:WD40 repeat protein